MDELHEIDEIHDDQPAEEEGVASRRRAGTFVVPAAVALSALIIAGVLALRMVGGESPPAAPPGEVAEAAIDVSTFPRGALAGEQAPDMSFPCSTAPSSSFRSTFRRTVGRWS